MENKIALTDSEILRSWHINAGPWIKAIDNQEIESRRLVTNKAIIEAILSIAPKTILDLGCGEGWLARELLDRGFAVSGVDAVPALIEKARRITGGTFDVCTYEQLDAYQFGRTFDCIICKFSLIGKESTEAVIHSAKKLLQPKGRLVIQTLHPVIAGGELPYKDGWREGSWAGFSNDFTAPAPWYFRTLGAWCGLFTGNGFQIRDIREPIHPHSGRPASIIFDLQGE